MNTRAACPRCSRRRSPHRRFCLGCGADLQDLDPGSPRLTRMRAGALLSLLVAVLLAANFSDRYVPAISDWYSRMVIGYVPDAALRFVPIADADRAFYICARAVVKRMGGESSIATFAGSEAATTRSLGDGRYQIESLVDESLEAGAARRHLFRCTLRSEAEEWVLEEVEIEPVEPAPAELVVRAP